MSRKIILIKQELLLLVSITVVLDEENLINMLFFFSSRRRHTRLQGDWSSDVCSSDLEAPGASQLRCTWRAGRKPVNVYEDRGDLQGASRSEERRVGKECRSRWSPY